MINDLQVPILVLIDPAVASNPIISYNVIEAIMNRNEGKSKGGSEESLHHYRRTAHQVVKFMQSGDSDSETAVVHTGRKSVPLPASQVTTVYVRAHVNSQANTCSFHMACSTPHQKAWSTMMYWCRFWKG